MAEKKYGGVKNIPLRDKMMPPETVGKMKRDNIFHMSIDELIEYKESGIRPKMIIDETYIYKLATMAVSIDNICGLFGISRETFCNNTAFLTAHQEGRSKVATFNRAAIAEQAANGNLDAQKYLDRLMGGDIEQKNVNLSIEQRPLKDISTETLINIEFGDNE